MGRAAVAASVAALATALAHDLAGGSAPAPLLLVAAWTWSLWVGFAVLARPSLLRTAVAIGITQPVMHLAFTASDLHAGPAAGLGQVAHAHGSDAHSAMALAATAAGHDGGAMLVAHIIAGVISIVALAGTRSVRESFARLARRLVQRLAALPGATAPQPTLVRTRMLVRSVALHVEPLLASSVSRRGPPAFAR